MAIKNFFIIISAFRTYYSIITFIVCLRCGFLHHPNGKNCPRMSVSYLHRLSNCFWKKKNGYCCYKRNETPIFPPISYCGKHLFRPPPLFVGNSVGYRYC
jgi:hypothetical protein